MIDQRALKSDVGDYTADNAEFDCTERAENKAEG
jgi:hypothetical protein